MKTIMKTNIERYILTISLCVFLGFNLNASKKSEKQILKTIEKVNIKWQNSNPNPGNSFWDNAAYHTGNMEAYKVSNNSKFLEYSIQWAEQNQWQGAKSKDRSRWKFRYGETDDFVLFGDWQICFQTYLDLYSISPDSNKIKRAIEVMEYQMSTKEYRYWWWVDGLYMVMPVMTKLYKQTGNAQYLDKLYQYYTYSDSLMQDKETGLFYRDAKYIYPKHKSVNGKKDFWARGNGWLFAGLAKIIPDLPLNWKHRETFVNQYLKIADALASNQQDEGYWTRSILDAEHAPGPETSGTAFFTYGFLWGINNGLLVDKKYEKTALKAWKYLTTKALQKNGTIGYIQPIGERAIPGQVVDSKSTANFGVGAFLLAASEMYRYEVNKSNDNKNLVSK